MTPTPAAPQPVLRLHRVSKTFGALRANRDVSLSLGAGEVLALLGENGAGKTTLMNILFGHYRADSGHVEAFGRRLPPGRPGAALEAGVGMVHQHFTLADNLTVLDNVILGSERLWRPWSRRGAARARLLGMSREFGLQIDADAPVGALSVGERQRVEILKTLYRGARVLILDEPTAVLTPQQSERLFETLRGLVASGLAVIFISHKLNEVLALADRVVVLRQGAVVAEVRAADADRASLATAMVGRAVAPPRRSPHGGRGGELLRLRRVSAGQRGRGRLREVSLTLRGGEILGIAGVSGNGQGALADLVGGLTPPTAGTLTLCGRPAPRPTPAARVAAGLGRIPEDRHRYGVVGELSVAENLILEQYRSRFSRFGWLRAAAIERHAERLIDAFDVRGAGPATPARSLSGGNMQKLILARALDRNPTLLLACQPTRGLDVGAAAYVHQRLFDARAAGVGVLLIAEDLDELLALSDRVAVLYDGRLSASRPAAGADRAELGLLMSGQRIDERGGASSDAV